LHDSSFLILGASLVISQVLLARAFLYQRRPRWMRFTLIICATVIVGFAFKGLLFYLMFLATSIWFVGLSVLMLKTNNP
jgi:membrane associated rhomboid family serine protease